MRLTPQQRRVLALPVWQEGRSVTRQDIVSRRDGDGLPTSLAAAQRVLCALNGGVSGIGDRVTWWTPDASAVTRMSYSLSPDGERSAAEARAWQRARRIEAAREMQAPRDALPLATTLFARWFPDPSSTSTLVDVPS